VGLSWKVESFSAGQKNPCFLWNSLKVHFYAHRILPFDPVLTFSSHFTHSRPVFKSHVNISSCGQLTRGWVRY